MQIHSGSQRSCTFCASTARHGGCVPSGYSLTRLARCAAYRVGRLRLGVLDSDTAAGAGAAYTEFLEALLAGSASHERRRHLTAEDSPNPGCVLLGRLQRRASRQSPGASDPRWSKLFSPGPLSIGCFALTPTRRRHMTTSAATSGPGRQSPSGGRWATAPLSCSGPSCSCRPPELPHGFSRSVRPFGGIAGLTQSSAAISCALPSGLTRH